MKRKLMERNVAEGIAAAVCESVAASLEGRKLSSFTGAPQKPAKKRCLQLTLWPGVTWDVAHSVLLWRACVC